MRIVYFIIGSLSMLLGILGILLPVLPTTPFLLLAAFCYARSSQRLHTWFLETKLYKQHLSSFVTQRAMYLKTKVLIVSFASIMLLSAMCFMDHLAFRIFLITLMIYKYYYFIFRIKTMKKCEIY